MSCPTRVSVGCRSGKADLDAVATCSAAGLLRFPKLGSFSSSAQLPPPSLLFLLLWMQAEPLPMHLHSTCCLIAEGVAECGLLQRIKSKKVYLPCFLQCLHFPLCLCPDEIGLILCCLAQDSPRGYGKGAPRELWCQQHFALDRCVVAVVGISTFLCKMYWQEFPNISLRVGECFSH